MPPESPFRDDPAFADQLDAADPLREVRAQFLIPPALPVGSGRPAIYLTGNSLGLQPRATRALIEQELDDWARLAVAAHLDGKNPWLPYHEQFRAPMARIVGALPHETVMMNSLTANLHLLMVSFYRPTPERHRIVVEGSAFPSDSYAVASQAAFHGYDPTSAIIRLLPRPGETTLRTDDIEEFFDREGRSVALVLLGAVNYLTGQWFQMDRITAAAKRAGCTVGWDLAHAAGNVPVRLHDCGADFAAWCTYKYLNSGPGAVAGAFVHESQSRRLDLPQFAGWWGNDPATRFKMGPDFVPRLDADRWQLSNPPILAMAPIRASLDIFDRVGMGAIREKSLRLTAYMEWLIQRWRPGRIKILTPSNPEERGAQLSLVIPGVSRDIEHRLHAEGIVVDFREPDVIRAAPTALYNTFADVRGFVSALQRILAS